ncbi:MAG: Coenzyme F420 hydrogenase/dehydrogenase, beta subunit C-terminal domain [Ruminococcus sp.]|nr:Coenzyme F420 hydrogenase/dehydrogenase, beta subunit C-terminal domain [Ruminococcus sp.]
MCCGCGACSSICPKKAITMKQDTFGFIYPHIEQEKCIDCGMCKKICSFQKIYNIERKNDKKICFAAFNKDSKELSLSSSGGVFSAIAGSFLKKGGVVCGASMKLENGEASVNHILIYSTDELFKLQGSKYVQSNMWKCIGKIKEELKNGKKVLFTGTPCQVDSIKTIFKNYVRSQLFTIDVICHGVPNQDFFNSYLKDFQDKNKIKLTKFDFRNKKYKWGLDGLAVGSDDSEIKITTIESSYYRYFIYGEIYRTSCYQCPYACLERVGDLTIGDYWGVEQYDSKLLDVNGGAFTRDKGVSCVLENTSAGNMLLKEYGTNLHLEPVKIENVIKINTQLREPAKHSEKRKKIFDLYAKYGYSGVENMFQRRRRYEIFKASVKKLIPKPLFMYLKKIKNK